MKVILLSDVKGKGKKNSVIEVSDGYANNYLIKNNLAVLYTKKSKEVLESELKEKKNKEDELVNSLNEIKKVLENKVLTFKVKTGKDDRVFGSISSKQIQDKLKSIGYDIDKKYIKINDSISSLGRTMVEINLHKKVSFNVFVELTK